MRCHLQKLSTIALLSLALGVLTLPGCAERPADPGDATASNGDQDADTNTTDSDRTENSATDTDATNSNLTSTDAAGTDNEARSADPQPVETDAQDQQAGADTPADQPTTDEPTADSPTTDKPAAGQDVETLVSDAKAAAEGNDHQEALRLAEQALKAAPENRQALGIKALAALNLGMRTARTDEQEANRLFREAVAAARQVHRGEEDQPQEDQPEGEELISDDQYMAIFYYGAGALAQAGENEQAVELLKLSVENGFNRLELLESNEDLASLRETESYKEFVADLQKQAAEQAKVKAKELLAENEPFDFSFSLPSVQGETVSLKDYQGHVVIVDFWGTWCPPCRKEIPHFVELHKQHHDTGLRIVGINYEDDDLSKEEASTKIETFIEEYDIPYPCLLGDEETKERVPNLMYFPTTLFIDREGTVRATTVGYRPYVELEAIVDLLLAEGSAADTPASTTPATPDATQPATPAEK